MRLVHVGIDSLQALAKLGLLKGATTRNLKFGERCILDKETKVKFDTTIHYTRGLLDCFHIDVLRATKIASFECHWYFVSSVDDCSRHYWAYLMR